MEFPNGRGGWTGWEPEPGPEAGSLTPAPSLVRPYTLTAGRTESRVHLPMEAPIQTLESSDAPRWPAGDVRGQILAMCVDRPSVAEIAARLSVPLGVARVLIGDLVTQGCLRVLATLDESASYDERRELIGRTLRGLRAL